MMMKRLDTYKVLRKLQGHSERLRDRKSDIPFTQLYLTCTWQFCFEIR